MRVSQVGAGSTHQPFAFYLGGAALYLVMTLPTNRSSTRRSPRTRGMRRATGEADGPRFPPDDLQPAHRRAAADASVWFLSVVLGALVAAGVTGCGSAARSRSSYRPRLCLRLPRHAAPHPDLPRLLRLGSFPASARASVAVPARAVLVRGAGARAQHRRPIRRDHPRRLLAVPHGQIEAARACGMSGCSLFRRDHRSDRAAPALPAYSTEIISMVKATALVSLITLWEVIGVALKIRNDTIVTYLQLIVRGAIYLVVNFRLSAPRFLARAPAVAPSAAARPLSERRRT